MPSKQLTVSADNLLSLQLDSSLTLSSSVPSSLGSNSLPVRPSSAAVDSCKLVRRKQRVAIRQLRTTECVPYYDDVERRFCVTSHSVELDRVANSSSNVVQVQSADVATADSESDVEDAVVGAQRRHVARVTAVDKRVTKLPRSGSNIARKKAFYNVERPVSVNVRRDSSSSTSDDCLSSPLQRLS